MAAISIRPTTEAAAALAHALPAGRNMLHAVGEPGFVARAVLANHGAATCKRLYLWRIA